MGRSLCTLAVFLSCAVPAFAQSAFAPAGAHFAARLDRGLDTKRLHDGDRFTLTTSPLVGNTPPALRGARIEGHVEAVAGARGRAGAAMNLILDDIVTHDGAVAPIQAMVLSIAPRARVAISGPVAGRLTSRLARTRHGMLIGAATGVRFASSAATIALPAGTTLQLRLTKDIALVG